MKLLVIGNYYEPEVTSGIYLAKNLYETLAEYGVQIDLIVPSPSRGINSELYSKYFCRYEEKNNGYLRIHRIKVKPEKNGIIRRAFRYMLIQLKLYNYAVSFDADIVFAQSTPPIIGITASMLSKKMNAPFIYNLHDVFPDSMVNANLIKESSIIYKIGRIIENYIYKNATKIIAVSDGIKDNIIRKNVPVDKIQVINNWVDEDEIHYVKREDNPLFKKWNLSDKLFYVVYAGNLGTSQNVDVILEAAGIIKQYDKIKFIIIGNGAEELRLKSKAKKMKLNNLLFFPMQPYSEVSNVYSLGDVCIVTCKSGVGSAGMPSKTWSIMITKRPLIICFDKNCELWNLVQNTNSGLCGEPDDAKQLANNIMSMYNDQEMGDRMGANGQNYIFKSLSKSICVEKYIHELKSVLAKSKKI